jgi:hypothetical protein
MMETESIAFHFEIEERRAYSGSEPAAFLRKYYSDVFIIIINSKK